MKITKEELRELYINYQGYNEFFELDARIALEAVFDRIRSVQFDPLNVIGRNAELACFARNGNVRRADLHNALYGARTLVDGWDKMMCIYRAEEFDAFAFVREQATKQYELTMAWRGQNDCFGYMDDVFSFIESNGAAYVSEIPSPRTGNGGWGPTKTAGVCCEYLWNSGKLVVSDKKGVIKQFDSARRIFGERAVGNRFSSFDEFIKWYVLRRLASTGALRLSNGGGWLGVYLEDGKLREKTLGELAEEGKVVILETEDGEDRFYTLADNLRFIKPTSAARAVFIPPLDNLIWDRKIVKSIFDFDYSWEVYTPQSKRKFGYYVLPMLIGNRFVGRIEPVLDKRSNVLTLKNIWFENGFEPSADDVEKIGSELVRLAQFLDADIQTDVYKEIARVS